MTSTGTRLTVWLVMLAVAAVLAGRLNLTYDLAFFLPAPTNEEQRILIERIGQGPGSQLIFAVLPTDDAGLVNEITEVLAGKPDFANVLPRDSFWELDAIPDAILENRYLLRDVDISEAGLAAVLAARLRDLAVLGDADAVRLIARDPHLAVIELLSEIGNVTADAVWTGDHVSYVLAQTRAAAFDVAGQAQAIAQLQDVVVAHLGQPAELYGPGVYSVLLQRQVRSESVWFTGIASVLVIGLILVLYRRVSSLLFVLATLAAAGVLGLAVLSAMFAQVHGITLAFGFTLLGVTVDYSLHMLSHSRNERSRAAVWGTLRLGILSSVLAYAAFVFSGSKGLEQLGVFSVSGILGAAFSVWLLSPLLPLRLASNGGPSLPQSNVLGSPRLRHGLWVTAVILGGAALYGQPIWNSSLAALTPVPPALLAEDRVLRAKLNVPDLRYLVATHAADIETVLERVEVLADRLNTVKRTGNLKAYQAVTQLIPSLKVQDARRMQMNPAAARRNLEAALADLPFSADAFTPFLDDYTRTAEAAKVVNLDTYRGSDVERVLDSMLYQRSDGWVALTYLQGMADPSALEVALSDLPGSLLVDLVDASRTLLISYRERVLWILGIALVLIAAVLIGITRTPGRVLWLMGTISACIAMTAALSLRLLPGLSIFDLMAMTLVAGLGLDYGLFFSRVETDVQGLNDTRHGLVACALSSIAVFAILSLSSVPLLHGIGTTVAIGITVAYLLARYGQEKPAS